MSIFEIFAVKNTPTYVASKELIEKLQEANEGGEKKENNKEETSASSSQPLNK